MNDIVHWSRDTGTCQ